MVRLSSLLMVLEPCSSVALSKEIQDPLSWNLDSTLRIPDSRYWIPDSVPLELGARVAIVSEIPDSTSIKFPGLSNTERYSDRMQLWLPRVYEAISLACSRRSSQNSSTERLFQPTLGPISALGSKSSLGNWPRLFKRWIALSTG